VPGGGEAGTVEVWSAGEGTGWVVDALSVAIERAGWTVVVPRTAVAEGKWGTSRTRPVDDLVWFADSSLPPSGRRGVWVLAGGEVPAVPPTAIAPRRVVDDPVGIDGAPFAVWVG